MTIVNRRRHVDGVLDVDLPSGCSSCHGSSTNAAPPASVLGATATTDPGVGAHQAHLLAGNRARPVPCEECHAVPDDALSAGHVDSTLPAEVAFSGVALAFGGAPIYENGRCEESPCHGAVFPSDHDSGGSNTSPSWTRVGEGEAACGTCHGLPPPRPHPYVDQSPDCSQCHENLNPDNQTFARPDLHVDGEVTFEVP
jgi:hypothetical protein